MSHSNRSIRWFLCGTLLLAAAVACSTSAPARASTAATTAQQRSTAAEAPPRAFAYYYLWWSTQHWHDKLGSTFGAATNGFTGNPLPLPATLDASGCTPTSRYSGNELVDVAPQLWTQ